MRLHLGGHLNWYELRKRSWIDVKLANATPLTDLLVRLGVPAGEVAVVVVNRRAVELEAAQVKEDDVVELYPPIGGGVLTGKYNKKNFDPKIPKRISPEGKRLSERNLAIAEEVEKIANEIGRKPSQVALNWVRQREQQMIPIIGARTAAQLAENLDCVNFELTPDQIAKLNQASAVELGFPHDFLQQPPIQELVFAGTQGRILRR